MVAPFEKTKCSGHKDVTFYKEKSFVNTGKVVYNILCVCMCARIPGSQDVENRRMKAGFPERGILWNNW